MIYLFYGDNTHAARVQVNRLIERYQSSTGSGLGLQRFSDESQPDEIINAMTATGMFSDSSLIVVEHPSRNKQLTENLLASLERVPQQNVLVLFDPEIDKRSKWFKSLNKLATVKEFSQKKPEQMEAWAVLEAKSQGFTLDKATARLLVARTGNDQWRLVQELKKLSNVDKEISKEVIEELVEPTLEQSIFDLLDALSGGQTDAAIDHYRALRAQNVHQLEILTMLGWQLRNLVVIKSAEGRSDGEIAKDAGINPYVIRKSRGIVRRNDLKRLVAGYKTVIGADYRLKTGSVHGDAALEDVIMTIGRRLN